MKLKNLLFYGALTLSTSVAYADLQINEIMQSNVHGIMDDLNDFPDSWVELYNNNDTAVSLKDYALSVKDSYKKAYKLPDLALQPGEFIVIYCDKADVSNAESIHADFRVDSGKGFVYLWKNGEILQSVELKKMVAPDVSYGLQTEQGSTWGYQANSTPNAKNCGKLVSDILPEPVFSVAGGLQSSPLQLKITKPADAPANATLRYTLDGSVPTAKSPQYLNPIDIAESSVVRAALFADGYITPLPTTQSYIYHPREVTLPIVSMVGNPEYFYDDKIGILVEGSYTEGKANYMYDWRRPVNVEYFEPDGRQVINQVIETRLKGNSTRNKPLRSMVMYANKRFVTKRLTHEFFPEDKPGLSDFKSVELRNSGQDFHELYQRDALCQMLIGRNTDMDWQAYNPVVLYVNGEYKGLLNMRERANDDYIYTNYNGLEDVDVIENWGTEVKAGTKDTYSELQKFYYTDGHTLAEYSEIVDINEFLNWMIAGAIFCNTDFPANNCIMWRPTAQGGRWRWIAKDFDTALGFTPQRYDFAYLSWLYDSSFDTSLGGGNHPNATLLFRQLMKFDEVHDKFIDRVFVYMGDFMSPEALSAQMQANADLIASEQAAHRKFYNIVWGWNDPDVRMEFVNDWYAKRVDFMYDHTAEFFKLNAVKPLEIENPEGLEITVNGITLKHGNFNGKWAIGRKLELAAGKTIGETGVIGWKVITHSIAEGDKETTYNTPILNIAFPNADSVKIRPILGTLDVEEIELTPSTSKVEWFDLQGRSLGTNCPAPGIYLRKAGDKVTKTIVK